MELLPVSPGIVVDGASLLRMVGESSSAAREMLTPETLHDLRQAANVISSFAGLLLLEEGAPRKREYLEVVARSAAQTQQLVHDLLFLSRTSLGLPPLRSVTFSPVEEVERTAGAYRLQTSAKGVALAVYAVGTVPARVTTDLLRLRRVLANLLANAVRHTHQGTIEVTVGYSEGALTLRVADTGEGIAPELHEAIFEPEETTGTQGGEGLGLGLRTARRLAERLGGSLILERSEPGVGSVFRVVVRVGAL